MTNVDTDAEAWLSNLSFHVTGLFSSPLFFSSSSSVAAVVHFHAPKQPRADWMKAFIRNWNKPDLRRHLLVRHLHIFLCNFRMTCVSIWLSGSRFRNIFMALSRFEEAAAKLLSQRTQIFQRSAYFFALSLPLSLPCRRHFSHPLDFRRDCFWVKHHDIVINGFSLAVACQAYADNTNRKIMYLQTVAEPMLELFLCQEKYDENNRKKNEFEAFPNYARYYLNFVLYLCTALCIAFASQAVYLGRFSFSILMKQNENEFAHDAYTYTSAHMCGPTIDAHTIAFNFVDAWNEIISNVQHA